MESALENYPKTVVLKNGTNIVLRPLVSTDYKALSAFLKALPSEDLIFLKERISDPKVIRRWCTKIDYGRTLHLLALTDHKIVGLATLLQNLGGWKRHVGRINVHTLPEYRGKGLGRHLVHDIISIARQAGLMWLEAELFDKQQPALRLFGLMGFCNVLQLSDYVKDMQAGVHDYILMNMKLITEEEYAGMG